MLLKIPRIIWILVASSILLRWVLICLGGQDYSPDEIRYTRSLEFGYNLVHYGVLAAFKRSLAYADHTLYTYWGVIPAGIQHLIRIIFKIPTYDTRIVGALFFAVFHALNILWIYLISLRLRMSKSEGILAAFFFFCSTSMLFYSRHLYPYDLGMFLQLSALFLALGQSRHSLAFFIPSVLATLGFLTYNAYWVLTPLVILIPLLFRVLQGSFRVSHWVFAALAPFSIFALLIGFAEFLKVQPLHVQFANAKPVHVSPYIDGLLFFSETIVQGLPKEGWSLPFAYLWHTEHALFLFWIAATLLLLTQLKKLGSFATLFSVTMLLSILIFLNIPSTLMGKMVVYGRMARQLVPFFCILSAALCYNWFQNHSKLTGFAIGLLFINTINNWTPIFTQSFPKNFERLAKAQHEILNYSFSIKTNYDPDPAPEPQKGKYVVANIAFLWPIVRPLELPKGKVLKKSPHPLQYKPYQYEGLLPKERKILRETDISMQLIETE